MRGINLAMLIGTLGADSETRAFNNGGGVTTFSIATSEQWTDRRTGDKREATEWHSIAVFDELGRQVAQQLKKGDTVYVEGSVKTKKYKDNNGQDRYVTQVVADKLQLLSNPISQTEQPISTVHGGETTRGNNTFVPPPKGSREKGRPDGEFIPPPMGEGIRPFNERDKDIFVPPPLGKPNQERSPVFGEADNQPKVVDDKSIPF